MGSVCLSLAPNLRCTGLSLKEEVFTLIPAGLEVIFSLGLVFAGRDAGRTRYILAAEGPTYFSLAFLRFLGRIIPLFQTSLVAFKALDIAIGAASCIPILLYTSYLYLFKRKEFFPSLPKRFTLFANAFSLVVIPIIIVTNEIGSFLGIMYRKTPAPFNTTVGHQVAIGPYYFDFQFGREFLSSTSLALLTIYQAITFLIFFSRLASRLMAQRDIEDTAASDHEGVLFRGTGWLSIGMKIAAVESALGFASTDFVIVLARRVLRFLARACVIIGVVKGPDFKENFLILDSEFLSGTRRLTPAGVPISSPLLIRTSMARRISRMPSLRSPNATFASPVMSEYEQIPPRHVSHVPIDLHTRRSSSTAATRPRPPPLALTRPSTDSRVTVVHGRGRAPTLVLNLSPMDLPSGNTLAAMSVRQSSMGAFDNVGADPAPPSSPALRTAPLLWITPRPPALLVGHSQSNEQQLSWERGRFHSHSSRRRTTPRPTSAGAVRASIVPKVWGDLDALVGAPAPQLLWKDSDCGLLSAGDPAHRRRTTDTRQL